MPDTSSFVVNNEQFETSEGHAGLIESEQTEIIDHLDLHDFIDHHDLHTENEDSSVVSTTNYNLISEIDIKDEAIHSYNLEPPNELPSDLNSVNLFETSRVIRNDREIVINFESKSNDDEVLSCSDSDLDKVTIVDLESSCDEEIIDLSSCDEGIVVDEKYGCKPSGIINNIGTANKTTYTPHSFNQKLYSTVDDEKIDKYFNVIKLYCKNCDKVYRKRRDENGNNLKNCLDCKSTLIFQCVKCKTQSNWLVGIYEHITMYHGDSVHVEEKNYFLCKKCNAKFKNYEKFKRHEKICSSKLFKCSSCGYKAASEKYYFQHLKTHRIQAKDDFKKMTAEIEDNCKGSSSIICAPKNFDINLLHDEILAMEKTAFTKLDVKYITEKRQKLLKDEENLVDMNKLPNVAFLNKNGINTYSAQIFPEEREKAFSMMQIHCQKCNYTQEVTNPLQKKCKKCEAKNNFRCLQCPKVCKIIQSLQYHVKATHLLNEDQQTLYQCIKCSKSYKFYSKLKNHWEICFNTAPDLICDQCSYKTKYKFQLSNHLKTKHRTTNTSSLCYNCDKCNKKFCNVKALEKHWRNVCKINNYICDNCGYKFEYKNHLIEHLKFEEKIEF